MRETSREDDIATVAYNFDSELCYLLPDLKRINLTWDECYALERKLQGMYTDFIIAMWKDCLDNPNCNPPGDCAAIDSIR